MTFEKKKMHVFVPSAAVYEKLLSQTGGSMDRYIFGQDRQHGEGLANFFGKLYRYAKPIIASTIKVLRPHALHIGEKLVDHGSKELISGIEKAHKKARTQIKRRRDNLDLQ